VAKIIVVIPALNEEKTVRSVIIESKKYADQVIVVDDASTDNTREIAQEVGVTVLSYSESRGYDKALEAGFDSALKHGANIIVTLDADGQHDPKQIPMIVEPILNGEANIVVGKRPRYNRISEYLFGLVGKVILGIDDPICGFKAYDSAVYMDIGYFDKISSVGTELMFNAWRKGYKIAQRDIISNKREGVCRLGMRIQANWIVLKAIWRILIKLAGLS